MGNRCTHQKINPNLQVGSGRSKLAPRAASRLEVEKINDAIAALKKAKTADSETVMVGNITEAYRLTREIARSRIL
ncbi:MAG: hypothetical protein Tp1125DCM00d2C21254131_33 [Prokaryotic dsDNA virus sp.]|nr:MAG: hypothetical protein Tp1125DCM00d2C21254131_33 [Prokaryotic dsDNA virus sp.]|tara:strand:+ start:734 stop:961 length:228 start_codon:yes stop_codon:yes gene_type:complete